MSKSFKKQHPFVGAGAAVAAVLAVSVGAFGSGASASAKPRAAASAKGSAAAAVKFVSPETSLPTSYPTPKKRAFTIGYLTPSSGQESLVAMQNSITAQVKKYGGKVITLDANLDVSQQVSQMQTLINDKVNAIAVYPLDPQALAPIVKRANAAGIPVVGDEITLNATQKPTGFASQVWLGPDETAYQIAKGMAQAAPHAKVGVIGFAEPVPYISSIVNRVKYWGKRFGLTILGESDNKDDTVSGGAAAATGLVEDNPSMNVLFTYNEDTALGAYSVVRSSGRLHDVKIFSNNGATEGIQGVKAGSIFATWQFDAIGAGQLLGNAALDAAAKVKIPQTVNVPAPKEIDAQNVASAKTWAQQLAAQR